jgi:hypothetical protein
LTGSPASKMAPFLFCAKLKKVGSKNSFDFA